MKKVTKSQNGKKQLSQEQEFRIMELVLDKFLWVGTIIMLYGLYRIFEKAETIYFGLSFIVAGAIIFILFMVLIIKEYEFVK